MVIPSVRSLSSGLLTKDPDIIADMKLLLPTPSPPVRQKRLSHEPMGTSFTITTACDSEGGLVKSSSHDL